MWQGMTKSGGATLSHVRPALSFRPLAELVASLLSALSHGSSPKAKTALEPSAMSVSATMTLSWDGGTRARKPGIFDT